jgi:hypothetical protein
MSQRVACTIQNLANPTLLLLTLVGLKRNQLKVHRFGREPLKEKVFVVFSSWEEKTKCSIFIKILNIYFYFLKIFALRI